MTGSREAQRERAATGMLSRASATAGAVAAVLALGCARRDPVAADPVRSSATPTAAELGAEGELEAPSDLEEKVRALEVELARARAEEDEVARAHRVELSALRT